MTAPRRQFRREPAWTNHVDVPEHHWDADRLAHDRDAPRFCPSCAAGLDGVGSIAVEYWQHDQRVFHVRCAACSWTGDIAKVTRMVGPDQPH